MELFLNSYGTYLHIKDEMFSVRVRDTKTKQVTTHPPIAAHKVERIFLTKGQALSTDAVQLALKHNIDIVFLEYEDGHPLGRIWHSGLGSTTRIRKRQLEASINQEAVNWVRAWLSQKMQNQIDFLKDLKKHRKQQHEWLDSQIALIQHQQDQLKATEAPTITPLAASFRGWEGTASRIYFQTLSQLLTPEYRFNGRSSRPAADPFNAFLNYAYGVLYSQVEKALMIAGLDPYLGFLHRDDYNQLSMVYDFIEPYRIYAQRVVFRLFSGKKVNQAHTSPLAGGVRLNEVGKPFLMENFNDYFRNTKIRYRNRNQTRANALQQDAHHFANQLLEHKPPSDL